MTLEKSQWEELEVSPTAISLDPENPRLRPEDVRTQNAIREALIQHEGVLTLCRQIDQYKGLFPTEKVVLIGGEDDYTVVEGNRRIAACQLLLDKTLSIRNEDKIPEIDYETRSNITLVPAVVAASREVADEVITNLHLGGGKIGWSLVGQMRYARSRQSHGQGLGEIASNLHLPAEEAQELILLSYAFDWAVNQTFWTDEERDVLWDFHIDLEHFRKAVLSPKTKKHFGRSLFLSDGSPNPEFDHDEFLRIVEIIARHTLLSQKIDQDRSYRREMSLGNYLEAVFPKERSFHQSVMQFPGLVDTAGAKSERFEPHGTDQNPEGRSLDRALGDSSRPIGATSSHVPSPFDHSADENASDKTQSAGEKGPGDAYRHQPEVFFSKLRCVREDEHFRQLVRELRRMDTNLYRIGASLVLRSVFEYCLTYHLKETGRYQEASKGSGGKPKLRDILKYCSNEQKAAFRDKRLVELCKSILDRGYIDDLNVTAHSDIGNTTPEKVRMIGGELGPVIRAVAEGIDYSAEGADTETS